MMFGSVYQPIPTVTCDVFTQQYAESIDPVSYRVTDFHLSSSLKKGAWSHNATPDTNNTTHQAAQIESSISATWKPNKDASILSPVNYVTN